MKQNKDAEEMS